MSKHMRRVSSKLLMFAPLLLVACGHMEGAEEETATDQQAAQQEEITIIQPEQEDGMASEESDPSALANACTGKSGKGTYKGYICDSSHNFITTKNITCQAALDNCKLNAKNNPKRSFYCTWNSKEVYRKELRAGICRGVGAK